MKNKTQLFHLYTFRFFLSVGLFLFFSLHPFCEEKVYASSWKVTQYGSDSDFQQSMFYTIKGSNGKLIVIDGGWDYDAKRVRDTIKKLGGKVNLWIITHPHPDHVGAFNQIFANGKQNEHLAVLRDTLLPKLMSGELDVSDMDL